MTGTELGYPPFPFPENTKKSGNFNGCEREFREFPWKSA
jgi:hypothetical protein